MQSHAQASREQGGAVKKARILQVSVTLLSTLAVIHIASWASSVVLGIAAVWIRSQELQPASFFGLTGLPIWISLSVSVKDLRYAVCKYINSRLYKTGSNMDTWAQKTGSFVVRHQKDKTIAKGPIILYRFCSEMLSQSLCPGKQSTEPAVWRAIFTKLPSKILDAVLRYIVLTTVLWPIFVAITE